MTVQAPVRIQSLTSIRAFAALSVVIYHGLHLNYPQGFFGKLVSSTVNMGFVGVDLFFILSGYILAYVYLNGEDTPKLDKSLFWKARFARIYPLYLFSFLLQVPFIVRFVLSSSDKIHHFFLAVATLGLNLAMLQAWDIAIRGDWNHPSWSMSAEAFFYLLFPFLGVKLWEKSKYWNIPIALIICYLVLMAPMLIYGVFGINAAFNNNNFPGIFLRFSPLFRPPEFALGILLMRLHHKILKDPRPKAMVANLFFWGGLAGALAGFYFSEQFRPSFLFGGVYDPFLAAILLGAALSQGFIASILSNKTLVLLGEASYGIYILQSPVGSWFWACLKLFSKTRPGGIEPLIPYPLSFFCYIVTLILVSVVTYLYLEKPLRIKIRNMNFGFLTQKSGQTR